MFVSCMKLNSVCSRLVLPFSMGKILPSPVHTFIVNCLKSSVLLASYGHGFIINKQGHCWQGESCYMSKKVNKTLAFHEMKGG